MYISLLLLSLFRSVLSVFRLVLFNIWGAVHCYLSTRRLREELQEMG